MEKCRSGTAEKDALVPDEIEVRRLFGPCATKPVYVTLAAICWVSMDFWGLYGLYACHSYQTLVL